MTISSAYPDILTNGTPADATQVMADFYQIQNDVNANAAHNGANSDITSLTGLTTPLGTAYGGTGGTSLSGAGIVTVAGSPTAGNAATFTGTGTAVQDSGFAPAPLVSPAFTGTPTAPTAAAGTNTTQIATTAFVQAIPGLLNIQAFTSSGTYTPTTGAIKALVIGVGGGGGGGGTGAGSTAGGAGGSTSLGSVLVLGGGGGGSSNAGGGPAGSGGLVTTATVGLPGSAGGSGSIPPPANPSLSGSGGPGLFGSGAGQGVNTGAGGTAGVNTGAGGAGGSAGTGGNSGGGGGGGAQGITYIPSLAASYAVTIGAAGAAGGGADVGGAGAAGQVIVLEF